MRHGVCAVFFPKFLGQQPHDVVSVGIARGKDQRLSSLGWRDFSGDRPADDAIESLRIDASVELGEIIIQRNLVGQFKEINLACLAVDDLDFLATLEMDTGFGQGSGDAPWWQVVVEIAFDDSLAVAIMKDWMAEDLTGVQRGCRRQRHLNRIEVIKDLAVGRLVVIDVAKAYIAFAQFGIQRIAAMGFIHDDAVKGARCQAL